MGGGMGGGMGGMGGGMGGMGGGMGGMGGGMGGMGGGMGGGMFNLLPQLFPKGIPQNGFQVFAVIDDLNLTPDGGPRTSAHRPATDTPPLDQANGSDAKKSSPATKQPKRIHIETEGDVGGRMGEAFCRQGRGLRRCAGNGSPALA